MYLKSIEVQGFKSFANKIVFEFHNGITAIVGPNGSGKSNVADAVRWVLGEQRAKQLRGAKMEDVIFAGTETRKPIGYAYVSITLDNSDHALPVEYDEVVVSRKVFRSGESEYLINGNACRLKDVNELFYDTGIGKEGYSIIGQGQIDKILSGKPEERRELFDEAAGIVKFKKRKNVAVKNLENERANLVRINDILSELEKQVGPLEKQSEKAKQYLKYKDELKRYDVNMFLIENDRIREQEKDISNKLGIVESDLNLAREDYDKIKQEYETVEKSLEDISASIDECNKSANEVLVNKGKLEGQIDVINEQIKTAKVNDEHLSERIASIREELKSKNEEYQKHKNEVDNVSVNEENARKLSEEADRTLSEINDRIEAAENEIEDKKSLIIEIMTEKSQTKGNMQRYEAMLEQINIRKATLNSQLLKGKNEKNTQDESIELLNKQSTELENLISELNLTNTELEDQVVKIKNDINVINSDIVKAQQEYHIINSKLESLKNIAERYDGYGNSIRRVMDKKSSVKGILGVVADIISVDKKYEIAIETALGGTIQNVVTDTEDTAKTLIAYLKENKFGRATFLPLSAISATAFNVPEATCEQGVLGIASDLVKVEDRFETLSKYLLGRILVVDNIDNALKIARKYRHSIRMVTVEGELISPGGSMTGGAFKNSSNLLGRRREIEELEAQLKTSEELLESKKNDLTRQREFLNDIRSDLADNSETLQAKMLEKNTLELSLKQAIDKKEEIENIYRESQKESAEIEKQIEDIKGNVLEILSKIKELDGKNMETEAYISVRINELENLKDEQSEQVKVSEKCHLELAGVSQNAAFAKENMNRVSADIERLEGELSLLTNRTGMANDEIKAKEEQIKIIFEQIEKAACLTKEYEEKIAALKEEKDKNNASHKEFFEKREALSSKINDLDKELYRLNGQLEKLETSKEAQYNYMWEEYELTYGTAKELKDEQLTNVSELKKNIAGLKTSIKALGDVNVNAIEDYKEVSERYEFLKNQHDDLVKSEEALVKIIDELDSGMRKQFMEKFEEIKVEFDKVFKELFGGGKGELELVEDEDILEAGIRIISQPPGKKLQNMMQLSGGEKALTAISLLFAIQNLKPSPFCLLDEIEAALDDSNVGRFAQYLHKLTKHTQFIVITHRRGTMGQADRLYGITMQEKGVSTLVSVDLLDGALEEKRA